jgi:hypothetical protein
MAGINLSGAIGMGGKRESVLSDVPSIIQHSGDFIAKARLEAKEQKAKLAAAQREKDLEDAYKNKNNMSNFMLNKSDLDPNLSGTFYNSAEQKINDYFKIASDPSIPKSVKDKKEYDTKLDISKMYNRYKDDEKMADYLAQHKEDPTMDISGAERYMSGTEGVYNKTTPILENEQTAPYKVNVPMEEAQISEQTTREGLRPDYYKLTAEERLKVAPEGLNKEVYSRIALKNTTPEKVAEDVLGGDFFKAAVKTIDKDGNISYQLDPNAQQVGERDYVYNVMNQTKTSAATLYKAKKAMAVSVLMEQNQNINPMSEEFDNLANEMVEKSVREDYNKIFNYKTEAIMDRIATRTKDGGRGAATSKENAPIEREVPANQDVVDEIKDKISEHKKVLDNYKTENKDRLSESRKIYNTPNVDRNSQEYKDASDEIIKYQTALQNKAALEVQLKNELAKKTKVKDLNAKDENVNFSIDGTNMVVDATGYRRDKDGNVFVYVNIPTGEKNVFEKKAIAYTPEMATELKPETINLLRKYGYIDENNEPIKTKKSVSSQPKEAPKDYGTRADGTKKGKGFLGEIKTKDGKVMTEKTTSVDFGLGEMNIPLIVNGLTKEEIDILSNDKKPTKVMLDKAVNHAKKRMSEGQSPYENGGTLKSKSGKKIKLNLKTNKFEYAE